MCRHKVLFSLQHLPMVALSAFAFPRCFCLINLKGQIPIMFYIRMLGTTIKVIRTPIFIGLIFLLSTCGQRRVLLENNWHVVDGTYMGQPIEFHNTDLIKLYDQYGNEIRSLNFSKNGTIELPGINSPNISARWTIDDGQIRFSVDSMRYAIYNTIELNLSFLDASDSIPSKQESKEETEDNVINPLRTKEFKKAMEIYEQSFEYSISRDTLILEGQKGRIRAVRDRTVENLFRNL